MKFSAVLSTTVAIIHAALAAPITSETDLNDTAITIPEEALIGFVDLTGDDISLLPFDNGTHTGVFFLNTTIAKAAFANETSLSKREASADANADAWSWISLRPGQPIFKREANAEAEAEASAWSWISLRRGQPIFKREASPEAEAEAEPSAWSWISLRRGQPIFKREASPEAEAEPSAWSWISLRRGQPIF
ncbi:unnamed protein product [Kluyveromyces dobzhanskii CBS 2104]|uniref:Mating factor alpha n=1 Tax=Kluyveromyces dobzhanskii CBS 2104 TaxID=1427455 RepID=A0A0A8L9R0_9SACH|nr:unnamed protein product [Kluyveromyces dobzhanskii CBS 2104]